MTHWWNIINKAQGAAVPVSMTLDAKVLEQEEQYIKTLENQIKPLQDKSSAGSISVEENTRLTQLQQRVKEQKEKITEMRSKQQPTQRQKLTNTLQQPQQTAPKKSTPQKNVGAMSPEVASGSDLSAEDLQALGLDPTKKPTQDAINAAVKRQKNIKSAKEISDKSVEQFKLEQAKQKGNVKRKKVNVPKMIDLPPTPEMREEADKDAKIARQNAKESRYKFERRKPFDAKNWQKQLQASGKKKELAEQEAAKQKRTASRTTSKDKMLQRISRRKDKALRREEKARRKQSKDDKASGLTDAGRRFFDNQQRVADARPRKSNVTSTGGL